MSHYKHTSRTLYEETQFEWELTDYFFNSATAYQDYTYSRPFHFGKNFWRLKLLRTTSSDIEFLFIENMSNNKELEVEYEIGLKKVDGTVEKFFTGEIDYFFDFPSKQVARTFKSEMLKRKHELAPPNGLTIKCILRRGTAQQFLLHQAPHMKFISK